MASPSQPKPARVKARPPAFRAEAHRQSLAVAESDEARADQAFIDAVSDFDSGNE